ncbi:XRE family transcriptional regulator [Xenorhabdus ishibashii]|uniref:Uncharacterized protein n=1 Tax=Xenorhabdus ishibashii TaxID=1034471 RepID=A0A2D0K835_9GAMM|nr:XRE family transcriptional regulator [Xenorhabdus ishibashii]PHM59520.1 hypothetical protein Xish_03639 [Xenorhabdus ishibashii]
MKFDKSILTPKKLIELRDATNLTGQEIADALGISLKSWQNKISVNDNSNSGKLKKLEYEFLLLLSDKHPDYVLVKRDKKNDFYQ